MEGQLISIRCKPHFGQQNLSNSPGCIYLLIGIISENFCLRQYVNINSLVKIILFNFHIQQWSGWLVLLQSVLGRFELVFTMLLANDFSFSNVTGDFLLY